MITLLKPWMFLLARMLNPLKIFFAVAVVVCCTLLGRDVHAQRGVQGGSAIALDQDVKQERSVKRQANGVSGTTVTLQVRDSALSYVLQAISKQANHPVVFDYTDSLVLKKVSVNIVNKSVLEAIRIALAGTGLTPVMAPDAETIVIRRQGQKKDTAEKQETIGGVVGRVVDSATQASLVNATITLLGTNFSAITEASGSFKLQNIPAGNYILSVRLIGYRSHQQNISVQAGKTQTLLIKVPASATSLSEVVTTVTGSQRKIELGNDITTLDVPEIMKQAPITSVTDLLEARVPGLTVMRTSGVPGAPSRIRLRGMGGGLLSNVPGAPTNDPIVVVDGIRIYAGQSGVEDQKLGGGQYPTPSPIDQIDPNSIEKIEVLRGPSASAMYGADAANGVIVITTKKGKAGAMRWDIAASSGIESMPGTYAQPGYYRFGHDPSGSFGNAIRQVCPKVGDIQDYFVCSVDSLVRFQALNEPRLSTIGHGTNNRLSGTASGGTKDLTYSVTGSIARTLGLTKMPPLYQEIFLQLYDSAPGRRMRRPNSLESKSGKASFSGGLTEGLTATFTTSMSQSVQSQSSANSELAALASMYMDTTNIHPGEIGQYAYQLRTKMVTTNHALALNLLRWDRFPLTATLGTNRVDRSAEGLTPRGILIIKERLERSVISEMSKGQFTERHENITTTTGRVNGTLFPHARISLSMGSEITRRSSAALDGYSDTLVQGVSRPLILIGGSRSGRNTTTGGWFLEPRLNVNSRFFVNPGFRFDGGGASGSRGGFNGGLLSLFPKLNFSWIAIDREGGEPLWGVISLVRPRFAFGIAGVQPAAEWSLRLLEQDVGTWTSTGHGIADSIAPDLGLRLRSVGNTKLGPEKTREVEGGFDLQLWETRLALSVTGFYKMRKNAIQQLPLAPSIGVQRTMNYYANIGHVRNTGGELSLNANVIDRPDIGWNIDISISKYTNTLTKLFGEQPYIDLGNGTRLVEGYPLFGRWSRPISGWTDPSEGLKVWYSDFVVADSAVYMGMQAPDFEMPFRTSLTLFRGLLSMHAQFNYKAGLTQYNLGGKDLLGNIYENPNSTYAQQAYALAAACFITRNDAANIGEPCTDYGFIQKVNSLRFNSVSVGYNVPRAYLKRFPISSLSLSLQGSNLGLWTNYRGKDPDVNGSLIGDVTRDSGQLPMPRSWNLHIRIGT